MTIKPDTQHSSYDKGLSRWKKCRDVLEGEDAVHAAGAAYLPKLSGQTDDEYKAYVGRTPFYGATARTVDGYVGMIFRKEPDLKASGIDALIQDITLADASLNEFAEAITREVIGIGRFGVLVEYPVVIEQRQTVAQAEAANHRPYATSYPAESILNWRSERVNNSMQLTMLALKEVVTEWLNEFESKEIEQIRGLFLEDSGTGYQYVQRVYRKSGENGNAGAWEVIAEFTPLMKGKPLPYIPFQFFGPAHNGPEIQKPPIYDLVTMNLSHYRSTADLEHGAHYTGLPTAVVMGYQVERDAEGKALDKFSIGSADAWVFPDKDADAKYLEFTGQGLQALENRIKDKQEQMAAIGARMLSPEKAQAEAAETLKLKHAGEGAVLSTISSMISQGLTRVLNIMAEWAGASAGQVITLNKDFVELTMTGPELTALIGAWQSGGISRETMFWNLQQGEMIQPGRTFEQEKDSIEQDTPGLTGGTEGAE